MIGPVGAANMCTSMNYVLPHKKSSTYQMITPVPEGQSVNSTQALSQMPNISFKASDASSVYDVRVYDGKGKKTYMSEPDQRIFRLSISAYQDIADGNYAPAIRKLLCVADIYRRQGRLDVEAAIIASTKELYYELPEDERLGVFQSPKIN